MKENLLAHEEFALALIGTYPEMARIMAELVEGTRIKLLNIHASFAEAAIAAQKIENDVDIILTRGGTGHVVKTAVSIPVISIPITPFDLEHSVSKLPPEIHRIAFVNYRRPIYGAEQIEARYHKEILQYQFLDKADLRRTAQQAKTDGCELLIGGVEGVSYAREEGLLGEEVVSGREAVLQALLEAVDLVRVQREEQKRSKRLKAAFDSLAEGICITDEHGDISVFNPSAVRLFRLRDTGVIGHNIQDVPMGVLAPKAFQQRKVEQNQLESIWNSVLNTNHLPIYAQDEFIGMVSTFQDVTKIQRLEGQIRQQLSQRGLKAKYTFEDILTSNPEMQALKAVAKLYAETNSTILIEGESGTGKELFANSIHNSSPDALGPFVTVNCAAIPEQLLESELFGYAPGAFTGARREGKQGLFELALNGTIFLDEIGEMPKYLQSRLLRVIQEKEVMRLGDNKIIPVNCRIISATNRNLAEQVAKGVFREDLYYRLNVFTIKVPPLRERREDISFLCEHYLTAMGIPANSASFQEIVNNWLFYLRDYQWPGNIRELASFCTRLALLQSVGKDKRMKETLNTIIHRDIGTLRSMATITLGADLSLHEAMEEAKRQYIAIALDHNRNNQSATAKQLEIGRTTLWRWLEE